MSSNMVKDRVTIPANSGGTVLVGSMERAVNEKREREVPKFIISRIDEEGGFMVK